MEVLNAVRLHRGAPNRVPVQANCATPEMLSEAPPALLTQRCCSREYSEIENSAVTQKQRYPLLGRRQRTMLADQR
jgi:hypothetical protein